MGNMHLNVMLMEMNVDWMLIYENSFLHFYERSEYAENDNFSDKKDEFTASWRILMCSRSTWCTNFHFMVSAKV